MDVLKGNELAKMTMRMENPQRVQCYIKGFGSVLKNAMFV